MNKRINFTNDCADFVIRRPEEISYLYFPLASETGLKSSISPLLGGDAKSRKTVFFSRRSVQKIFIMTGRPAISGLGSAMGRMRQRSGL